ncbi:MAG TPA: GreA/GreB family elongation factor [Aestuariivirga sp.]|nr:GreA/GreB family elongation factor [Aestuariivirga sp.]
MSNSLDQSALRTLCANALRVLAIDAVQAANSGHPGMPMGMADAALTLWTRFMRYNPANPAWLNRDLRYWVQRRSSAQLTHHPDDLGHVAFATRVTIRRADGRSQVFAIVGEDEADPAHGYIAYVTPMAHALMNRKVGEWAEVPGGEAEVVRIEALAD